MFPTSLILSLSGLSRMVSQSGQIFFSPPLSFLSLYGIRPLPSAPPPRCLLVAGVSCFLGFFWGVKGGRIFVCVFVLFVFLSRANSRNKSKHTWWRVQNITTTRKIKEPKSQQKRASNTLQETPPEGPGPRQRMILFNIVVLASVGHRTRL